MSSARHVIRRLLAGLAVLAMAAGCTGSANPRSSPSATGSSRRPMEARRGPSSGRSRDTRPTEG